MQNSAPIAGYVSLRITDHSYEKSDEFVARYLIKRRNLIGAWPGHQSTKARSITYSPGSLLAPSRNPLCSRISLMSRFNPMEPQIMTRSC